MKWRARKREDGSWEIRGQIRTEDLPSLKDAGFVIFGFEIAGSEARVFGEFELMDDRMWQEIVLEEVSWIGD